MVKHVVLWTFKPEVDKKALVKEISSIFDGFKAEVPGMKSLEVHVGFAGFDACLISEHEDKNSLDAYQNHPEHLKVKKIIAEARVDRAACDFEV